VVRDDLHLLQIDNADVACAGIHVVEPAPSGENIGNPGPRPILTVAATSFFTASMIATS
jgi:hypothetical protein